MAAGQVAGAVRRGEQQRGLLLAGEIDEMEQHAVVCCRGVLDDQRSGHERGRKLGFAERSRGNDARTRRRRPDHRQMRLAGPLRPDQGDGIRRPIRPAVDELERARVARSAEKIVAGIAFGVIERERELARAGGHGAQVDPFPV